MHYFPIPLIFLLFLFSLFIVLLISIEVGILKYAYKRIGINKRYIFSLLLLSLLGSYINIPLFEFPPEQVVSGSYADLFGMRYIIPHVRDWPATVIAVNLGGAVIPFILSFYLTLKNKLYGRALIGITIVALIVHKMAYLVRGVGIVVPFFSPPIAAAAVALILSRKYAPALAYISGTMGALIGADIMNLNGIRGLGVPVASIGGAGTFDGIFLTGIVAVLLSSFMTKEKA
jgi:uncharacterized membrane protein